jgi:ATP-dependent protease ClpP protease subunit
MLIHELSSGFWGKMREIKDDFKNDEELMKVIKRLYAKYSKVPGKSIDEILEHDIWWNSKKCLALKLVDEIS